MTVAPAIIGAWVGWALSNGNINIIFASALLVEVAWLCARWVFHHRNDTVGGALGL